MIARERQRTALEQLKAVFPDIRQDVLILEIKRMLSKVLNTDNLFFDNSVELTQDQLVKFGKFLKRRLAHEPLAYILNNQDFYSLNFYVDKNVLIPRPETELLVDKAFEILEKDKSFKEVLDIGSGSGAIILSLASKFRNTTKNTTKNFASNLKLVALDISKQACDIVKKNAESLTLNKKLNQNLKLEIIQSDLLSSYELSSNPTLFLSNPPYIPTKDKLMKDVEQYEPELALRGGQIGTEIVFRIIKLFTASLKLNKNNILVMEIGIDQDSDVVSFANEIGLSNVELYRDFSGINRIVKFAS